MTKQVLQLRISVIVSGILLLAATTVAFTVPLPAITRPGLPLVPLQQQQYQYQQYQQSVFLGRRALTVRHMNAVDNDSSNSDSDKTPNKLPFFLDPNTKGGAVFIAIAAFTVPYVGYNIAVSQMNVDPIDAGRWIGVGFTVVSSALWVASYVFRVATKDMTYVRGDSCSCS